MSGSRPPFYLMQAQPLLVSAWLVMCLFLTATVAAQSPPMNGISPLLGCPAIIGPSTNPCNWDTANIMWAIEHPHPDLDTIAAHRGIHALANTTQAPNVPENSTQAIGFAAAEGWEAIEIDVKITSDGTPIMSHDKSWGREWCGTTFFQPPYDPFSPNTGGNATVNPLVANTALDDTRSNLGTTYIRDSVSLVTNTATHGCPARIFGVFPPTLQDVYDYIRDNNLQMVVVLDIQTLQIASAAWQVVATSVDGQGRPMYASTMFKIPAVLFNTSPTSGSGSPIIFANTFSDVANPNLNGQIAHYTNVNFNPVFHTSGIAPVPSTLDIDDIDSTAVDAGNPTFGSEQAMIDWLTTFRSFNLFGPINVAAVEVSMKDEPGTPNGGILSTLLPAAQMLDANNNPTVTISSFNPVGEYYGPGTNPIPQFFNSSDGSCCTTLAKLLWNNPSTNPNNPNNVPPLLSQFPNLPFDHADNRASPAFLINDAKVQHITTDFPQGFVQFLQQQNPPLRNIAYMEAGGPAGFHFCAVENSTCSFTGNAQVAFGTAQGPWEFMAFTNGTPCDLAAFNGQDPARGVVKSCYYLPFTGSAPPPPPASTPLPCDIYATGGTPCVAAHSTVRALFSGYDGRLYQVQRASDNTTLDVVTLSMGGYADAASQDAFCAGTTCTITLIYDQSPRNNNLSIEGPGGTVTTPDAGAIANALPIMVGGHAVYGVQVTSGVGYRNNVTSGVAQGGSPEGMYMVTSGTNVNSGCCFDYGNAETSGADKGNGHMDALNFGTFCGYPPCNGPGPWVEADLENGQYMGNGNNTNNVSMGFDFVTAMLKNDGQATFALKGGNAQSGALIVDYSGTLPTVKTGYIPMSLEGAIVLGTGGDNSNWDVGSFFEGAMTSGFPTDAAEAAIQANIVAAGYGGNSGGTGSNTSPTNPPGPYTGPSDPNGPGPQDGFASSATEQPNDLMGSKPALASFNGALWVAFQANDAGHTLHVASSATGTNFPAADQSPDVAIGSAPAMAAFNNQLFIAFQANDASHQLFVTSSTGTVFPQATPYSNILLGSAPAMTVFNNQLYMAFQANDAGHTLHITASSDGVTWPTAWQIPNVQIGSAPAMVAFDGNLYVAFRANDASNRVFIAWSRDGVNFSSTWMPGLSMGGASSPALVVSNNVLYYIYGADDTDNEMLVLASTDGNTWTGPKAYLDTQLAPTGPAAAAFGNGVSVAFQSNDSRNVLFVTSKATEAAVYTGPSDPAGPGPQDGFASPAIEQQNDLMGTKPAMATFNGSVYVAFKADDASSQLFVTASPTGQSFPSATPYADILLGSAPAMAAFEGQLFIAFRANDSSHQLFVTSSPTGTDFPAATPHPNILMGSAPAMTVFNNQLYLAFQADDAGHTLFVTSSSDGVTWPDARGIGNVQIGSQPAMAVFNGKLYIAFRANDASNNLFIASSTDGVNFTSEFITGQTMSGTSSPALVVAQNTLSSTPDNLLYCIYTANDAAGEMLVTASTDGTTWLGPKAYFNVQIGPKGPAATTFDNGAYVGFQSNDSRDVLFETFSTVPAAPAPLVNKTN